MRNKLSIFVAIIAGLIFAVSLHPLIKGTALLHAIAVCWGATDRFMTNAPETVQIIGYILFVPFLAVMLAITIFLFAGFLIEWFYGFSFSIGAVAGYCFTSICFVLIKVFIVDRRRGWKQYLSYVSDWLIFIFIFPIFTRGTKISNLHRIPIVILWCYITLDSLLFWISIIIHQKDLFTLSILIGMFLGAVIGIIILVMAIYLIKESKRLSFEEAQKKIKEKHENKVARQIIEEDGMWRDYDKYSKRRKS